MIKLTLIGNDFEYEISNVIRLFFPDEKIRTSPDEPCFCELTAEVKEDMHIVRFLAGETAKTEEAGATPENSERTLAYLIYKILSEYTGFTPAWGIQTGVRPVKLLRDLTDRFGKERAERIFKDDLLVKDEKFSLAKQTMAAQDEILKKQTSDFFSLYISVPFCPSRCSYCSFISHDVEKMKQRIPEYVEALKREIEATAEIANVCGLRLSTVYIGGGTPTVLSAEELSDIMDKVKSCFDMSRVCEFTVEAGRPDTVTKEKLAAIKQGGATRISVNPQTLNDEVLKAIRRNHTTDDFFKAFELAKQCGFDNINTDLIAGLPGDDTESFSKTISGITRLSPASVTIHTLSVKRSSRMVYTGDAIYSAADGRVLDMLDISAKALSSAGYLPYYLYKQSRTLGNNENTGWARVGRFGYYNVLIMEEKQTILAVGAGASTKLVKDGQIKRIFNYKFPYEYLNGFDEILRRKEQIKAFYSGNPCN